MPTEIRKDANEIKPLKGAIVNLKPGGGYSVPASNRPADQRTQRP